MSFTIRKAEKADMSQVLALVNQLAYFSKQPDAVEVSLKNLQEDGFGDNPLFFCFVAEIDSKIEGIAVCYNGYSTWKGKVIHLEDLVVNESSRGLGIGTALLDQLIEYAYSLGVKRIDWEVSEWNEPAIKFYKHKGADVKDDWRLVHMDEQGIKDYMAKTVKSLRA